MNFIAQIWMKPCLWFVTPAWRDNFPTLFLVSSLGSSVLSFSTWFCKLIHNQFWFGRTCQGAWQQALLLPASAFLAAVIDHRVHSLLESSFSNYCSGVHIIPWCCVRPSHPYSSQRCNWTIFQGCISFLLRYFCSTITPILSYSGLSTQRSCWAIFQGFISFFQSAGPTILSILHIGVKESP